jgi:predicted ATPase
LFSEIVDKFSLTQYASIYLEEPEENLFPSTQYELVKWMAKQINTTQDNSLCIATHSPYILSSFNNLIQAADNKDSNVVETVVGKSAAIQFEDINVYAVDNGTAKDIKDYDLRLIAQTDLDAASDTISSDFSKLLES